MFEIGQNCLERGIVLNCSPRHLHLVVVEHARGLKQHPIGSRYRLDVLFPDALFKAHGYEMRDKVSGGCVFCYARLGGYCFGGRFQSVDSGRIGREKPSRVWSAISLAIHRRPASDCHRCWRIGDHRRTQRVFGCAAHDSERRGNSEYFPSDS